MRFLHGLKVIVLSSSLLSCQLALSFEGKNPETQFKKLVLSSVTDQFARYKTTADLESTLKTALPPEDMKWLQSQPDYKNVLGQTKISQKGETLFIKTSGQPDVKLTIINQKSLTFKINGTIWQYRPFLSLEKNMENLKVTLAASNKTSLLEKAFLLALPAEAQAIGFFAVIGVGVVVIVAATTICSMVVRGSDALGCMMIPFAPVMAAGALIDLATSMKKTVSELGNKTLLYKDLQCTLDKKGNVQEAKLLFTEGSLLVDIKNINDCKVKFELTDPKVKKTPYKFETRCDDQGVTTFMDNGQKEPPKEYSTSMWDNLMQTSSLVDLCKDPEKRRAFKEQMSSIQQVTTGPEISEERVKRIENFPEVKGAGAKTKQK